MRTREAILSSILVAALMVPVAARAGTIPYPNVGSENPETYTFTAAQNGDVIAYYLGNGGAGYTDTVGLLVNGVSTGVTGLNNHSSSFAQAFDLGYAHAGDTLTFVLNVLTTGNSWYSTKDLNADGANHVYATSFAGIPAATYLGFEDLAAKYADFNYTDDQFVATNVNISAVPLPGALPMLGMALVGLTGFGFMRRRQLS